MPLSVLLIVVGIIFGLKQIPNRLFSTSNSSYLVPWCLRNKYNNYMIKVIDMYFTISDVYREGNSLADKLVITCCH